MTASEPTDHEPGNTVDLRQALREAEEERDDLRALFDLQQTRMTRATDLWRQEAPVERGHILPDLGVLLEWLMARKTDNEAWPRRLDLIGGPQVPPQHAHLAGMHYMLVRESWEALPPVGASGWVCGVPGVRRSEDTWEIGLPC